MSIIKEYFYNIECDVCGECADIECWHTDENTAKEYMSENGFTIKFKVTVKPEVELKAYKGIKAEKEKVTVKKAEVKEEVERALEKDAKLVAVEGKAAKKGDIATIDFEGFLDGVAFEGGKGENYDLELGSGSFIPGFEEQVIGHKVDEEFDIDVTFPEDYGSEELAGKAVVFKIKLHKIMKKELPKYDDEFVKDVSEFDTIADYEKSLEEEIKTPAIRKHGNTGILCNLVISVAYRRDG